ncbi:MAG: 4-(cytidine 5'-diphospho)-2-C-methyl-D-erythritol kinase [Xanthomonadales bacterium]|nr:4-(cytidine 5'-diphospho)-2-C-methyl-D-erythritol kinase [Xanthomonadales bacterium]
MTESAAALVLPAPAKLNLFLHVTGRRPDGYHTLQTLFQLLDWGDRIVLRRRADDRIVRAGGVPGLPEDNDLAVRAAQALRELVGGRQGVDLRVEKRIPAGAGLGGGSSDAATVLLGLDHLWGLGLGLERLATLGLTLGADVPVFVHGRSGLAGGVGEAIEPMALAGDWFTVVWPGVGLATGEVFQAPELTRNTPPLTMSALVTAPTRNDLQPVAVRLCPVIGDALAWLSMRGQARMTGSGSAVFAPMPDEIAARNAAAASPWPAWAVKGVAVSPLHQALGIAPEADSAVEG